MFLTVLCCDRDLQKSVVLMNDLVELQTKQLKGLTGDEKQLTAREFGKVKPTLLRQPRPF